MRAPVIVELLLGAGAERIKAVHNRAGLLRKRSPRNHEGRYLERAAERLLKPPYFRSTSTQFSIGDIGAGRESSDVVCKRGDLRIKRNDFLQQSGTLIVDFHDAEIVRI